MKNKVNKGLLFSKEDIVELNANTLKATDSGHASSWTIVTRTLTTLTTITYPPTITIL